MTTQEKIAIMQAFLDGKTIQFQHQDPYNDWIDFTQADPTWDWGEYIYRIKPDTTFPKTWEEFCKMHPTRKGECFISGESDIKVIESDYINRERECSDDRNLLPNRHTAEAMLALCQLIQLRDCYNDGWKPDWNNDEQKHVVQYRSGGPDIAVSCHTQRILYFKTEDIRDKFLENFKDLMDTAKELL